MGKRKLQATSTEGRKVRKVHMVKEVDRKVLLSKKAPKERSWRSSSNKSSTIADEKRQGLSKDLPVIESLATRIPAREIKSITKKSQARCARCNIYPARKDCERIVCVRCCSSGSEGACSAHKLDIEKREALTHKIGPTKLLTPEPAAFSLTPCRPLDKSQFAEKTFEVTIFSIKDFLAIPKFSQDVISNQTRDMRLKKGTLAEDTSKMARRRIRAGVVDNSSAMKWDQRLIEHIAKGSFHRIGA